MTFIYLILFILLGAAAGYVSSINETFLTFYLYGWASMFVLSGIAGYIWSW